MPISIKTNVNYQTYGHELWKIHMLAEQTAVDGITHVPLTTSGNVSWTSNTSSVVYDTSTSADPQILNKGTSGLLYWLQSLFLLDTGSGGYGDSLLDEDTLNNIIYAVRDAELTYAEDGGISDAYAISLPVAPTAYSNGQQFNFKAATQNSGACTLNLNGLGAVNIKDVNGNDLETGDILAGQEVQVIYDGTNFVMFSPSSKKNTLISYIDNKNYIINGGFDVWQRGTSFTSATTPTNNDDTYLADHWNLISDGNDVLDVSQQAITDLAGSNYSIKLDVETSARGGIVQFLEAKDAQKFKGKYVSLSFAVKSANISAIRAAVLSWGSTADYITSDIVSSWDATPTWAANWTAENAPSDLAVTSSWTTVKIENIYVDSVTVNNLALAIWMPNKETIGDIIYISQVKLEIGSFITPFVPKSYEEEFRDCTWFFEKVSGAVQYATFASGCNTSTNTSIFHIGFLPKRIAPTIEFDPTLTNYEIRDSGGSHAASAASATITTQTSAYVSIGASGLSSGNGALFRAANPTYINVSAEL